MISSQNKTWCPKHPSKIIDASKYQSCWLCFQESKNLARCQTCGIEWHDKNLTMCTNCTKNTKN